MITEIAYKDKEEWLALRKKLGVGGSDAGAVLGFNPYKSAYELWAEKTGRVAEFEGNLITDVGSYLEEFVAKLFEKETGKKVRRKNRMIVNDLYPFAFGDVDRVVVGEHALLEIKTTNSFPVMRKVKGGEFPEQWYAQIVHYMAVGGFKKAYLAVLINCREFKWFELERDEDEIAALMDSERIFWEGVCNDIPPSADGSQSTLETLSAVFPESNEETVSLFAYDKALSTYMDLIAQKKSIEALIDEQANVVKAFMGNAGRGESDRYKVTWTSGTRSSFDSKRFAEDHKHIDLTAYYKSSNYRTFKVTAKADM